MKPEEAKQKYCPFKYFNDKCCVNDCMAWEWNLKKEEDNNKTKYYKYPYEVDTEDGYCKLIDK